MARFKQCERAIIEGTRIRFRSKRQIMEMKASRTGKHANTWFLRGNRSNILKVSYTPNNKLRSELDKALNKGGWVGPDGGTTQVVELGGKLISSGLAHSRNFGGDNGCQMGEGVKECLIAPDSNCRVTRSVYWTWCINCKENPNGKPSACIGTTGRTLHSRQL